MKKRFRFIRKDPSHSSTDALRQEQLDLGALANALHAKAARVRVLAEEITDEVKRREGSLFDITDHALVQYLKRCKGQDLEKVRDELKTKIKSAVKKGPLKSEAEAYLVDGLVFVVARKRLVVTIYPEGQIDEIEPMILAQIEPD